MEQCTYTSSFVIKFPCLFWTSRSMRVNVSPSLFPFLFICFLETLEWKRRWVTKYRFRLVCLPLQNRQFNFKDMSATIAWTYCVYSKFVEVGTSRPNLTWLWVLWCEFPWASEREHWKCQIEILPEEIRVKRSRIRKKNISRPSCFVFKILNHLALVSNWDGFIQWIPFYLDCQHMNISLK